MRKRFPASAFLTALAGVVALSSACVCSQGAWAQTNQVATNDLNGAASLPDSASLADAPSPAEAIAETAITIAPEMLKLAETPMMINGRPYVPPTAREQFTDYLKDTYGLPALARTMARAGYAQARGKPEEWGQDWPGFGQRFGSAAAVTAIDGNVRYGMEMLFHEDMRYIPCHGCSVKRKLENALLAEVTARHDSDGHRFFTLTPTITDMTGPIIANAYWVPGKTAIDGFVGSRLIFATRIGGHLFTEFVLERRHKDNPLPDSMR
jgi:hypothetical protein